MNTHDSRAIPESPRDSAASSSPRLDGARPHSLVTDTGLRRLFDANVIGIVIANNAGAILEANDAFLATLGYTRGELERGLVDWRSATPVEWLHLDERAIVEMRETGAFAQYEKEYLRRDGTRVPVSLGGARIAGTDDQQICYVVDLSDIRRAEAALRRSESRFKRLRDANVLGIMTSRYGDQTIVAANDELLRIIGYSHEDLAAGRLRWPDITPPEFQETSRLATSELRENRRFGPIETEYVRKDGARVHVLVGGALLEGSDEEIVCYVLDQTDRVEATRRLVESEGNYKRLADALPEIIIVTDERRQPVYFNRRYEEYTGLTMADAPNKWLDVIHPADAARVNAARARGESYEVEYRLRRFDGTYRWHLARVIKVADSQRGTRWLGAAMDIDDRKRAEETLRFNEKAGTLLARSLDLETTFRTALDLVVPEFGDWAVLNLRGDDGRLATAAIRHADPERDRIARDLLGVSYHRGRVAWGTAEALRTAEPQLAAHVDEAAMVAAIEPAYFPIFAQLGYGSIVALPVLCGDEVLGSLGIVSAGGERTYTNADLAPLSELARRVGFAIANARMYGREHRAATSFQEAALPRALPSVPGFAFDGYYRAGRREANVGGDWYDVVVVADGRIVVSVGDVAGSGLEAAVLMGTVRQVIRGAAGVRADPLLVLDVADRMLRSEGEDRMVTAFVGVIDPAHLTLVYASAGHVPALVRDRNGLVTALDVPGLPLGFRGLIASEARTTQLAPGSCLLLYTDGLVEWSRDILAGEELLHRTFAASGAALAAHPARAVVDAVLPPGGARDDVAALTISVANA